MARFFEWFFQGLGRIILWMFRAIGDTLADLLREIGRGFGRLIARVLPWGIGALAIIGLVKYSPDTPIAVVSSFQDGTQRRQIRFPCRRVIHCFSFTLRTAN
jgi:hypothetical protein